MSMITMPSRRGPDDLSPVDEDPAGLEWTDLQQRLRSELEEDDDDDLFGDDDIAELDDDLDEDDEDELGEDDEFDPELDD